MMFQHKDDTHGGRRKGGIAQSIFRKSVEIARPGCTIEKASSEEDKTGIDYWITSPDGTRTSYEVTSHEDPRFSRCYLRVTVGSEGNSKIKHLFNLKAQYWAFYNPRHNERQFLIYDVTKCREYVTRNFGHKLRDKVYSNDPELAAQEGLIYRRHRPSYGSSDLIAYIPIHRVEGYAYILRVPEEALPRIEE